MQYWNPKLFPTRLAERPVALAKPTISRLSSLRKSRKQFGAAEAARSNPADSDLCPAGDS